jgi:hypothetical protein
VRYPRVTRSTYRVTQVPISTTPPIVVVAATAKPWWQSKTVLLNTGLAAAGVFLFLAKPENDPQLSVASISATAYGVVMVVLRVWFTDTPIAHI